jgi:PHP family Zn ribbon phosphoesterase
MTKQNSIVGLLYRKIDLHVHTPASKCFDIKSVKPEDIMKKALSEGLDAIAITDHNAGAWVDEVKEASNDKLVIFPCVEISATAGKRDTVHIIGVFDQSKTTKDIENLLGDLGIKADKYGDEEAFTNYSPNQVINEICEHEGLAILAHTNSEQGVWGGFKGNPRTEIIQNLKLVAVEATDFDNLDKKKRRTRVADSLDGTQSEYRKLPIYQASDNPCSKAAGKHSLLTKQFEVKHDPEQVKLIFERFQKLHDSLKTDKIPEPEAKTDKKMDWMCRCCEYEEECKKAKS